MIMSSSTSLPGAVDVERLRRVELLRAELDRSLKVAAAASSLSGAAEKRSPLCILFHSADSVHIQFSGSARASVDLFARPRVGTASRFIVSPTPNAVPPAAVPPLLPPKTESSTASAWPLRVLTTTRQKDAELLENVACATAAVDKDKNESSINSGAIILLPTPPLVAASSPASSVDSGVASPGAAGDFLLNTAPFRPSTTEQQRASHDNPVKLEQCSNSPNSVKLCRGLFNGPSWATVPRTRRWIFNFSSNKNINDDNARSPLIDALALSSSLSSGGSTTEAETVKKPTTVTELSSSALQQPPVLTLQKPPLKKKYGQNTDNSHQSSPPSQSEVSSNGYSSNLGNNNFSSTLSPTESPMVAVKTESVVNNEEVDSVASRRHPAAQQPSSNSSSSVVLQRQFSDGCCYNNGDGTVLDADTEELHGLPPRAATLPPLRSILKKPRASAMMVLNSNGQQLQQQHFLDSTLPRNHLRRMPTRIVLERSVSESLLYDAVPDDQFSTLQHSAAAVFNASILRKLSMASTPVLGSFDEKLEEQHIKAEQEQQQQKQNNSGSISSSCCPSSCSSETIDSDGSGQSSAAPIAKKRVSFSEHVQARIYRSNSSILGQRRKNEKKSRNRCTRRCSSDVEHSSATEAEVPQQQQPQQHHHDVVSSSSNNNNNISCKFYERPPLWALQSRQDFNRWRQEKEEVALWSSASSVVAGSAVPTGVASQCV